MTPWVKRLLIANFAVFFISTAVATVPVAGTTMDRAIMYWGAFIPALALVHPWSVISYMFLHGGFMHIFFNMLGLFFFGPRLEVRLGHKRFLTLYLLAGVTGALLYLPTQWGSVIPMVGASGAVYGVLLGFAYFWPREKIFIWGVLPVEARILVAVFTAISLYSGVRGGGVVAHFAHLGGFLGAYLYLKYLEHNSPAKKWQRQMQPQVPVGHGGNHSEMERWTRIRPDDLHPVNRDEVLRLLEKVRQHGASGLTPTERDTLNRFTPILH
jgi:membrane associated rhomboid family serine protease